MPLLDLLLLHQRLPLKSLRLVANGIVLSECTLLCGDIAQVALSPGAEAEIEVRPDRGFDFGAGSGKAVTRKVRGGPLGVIFDARGRPLVLPTDLLERRACLNKWIKALRVYG